MLENKESMMSKLKEIFEELGFYPENINCDNQFDVPEFTDLFTKKGPFMSTENGKMIKTISEQTWRETIRWNKMIDRERSQEIKQLIESKRKDVYQKEQDGQFIEKKIRERPGEWFIPGNNQERRERKQKETNKERKESEWDEKIQAEKAMQCNARKEGHVRNGEMISQKDNQESMREDG